MTIYYVSELGIPMVVGAMFFLAARRYNREVQSKELNPEYFRAPSNYVVTVAGIAFPLIGAILTLQQAKLTVISKSFLVSGLMLFLLALLIGAWLTYAIISHANGDKVVLTMPRDWPYVGAIGLSYVFLLAGLINCFCYFAFGLSPPARL